MLKAAHSEVITDVLEYNCGDCFKITNIDSESEAHLYLTSRCFLFAEVCELFSVNI